MRPARLEGLARFLERPDVVLTGRNVAGDITRIGRYFGRSLSCKNVVCLGHFAKAIGLVENAAKGSLADFVRIALLRSLPKDPVIRKSDWSGSLTEAQLQYAGFDCLASRSVYLKFSLMGGATNVEKMESNAPIVVVSSCGTCVLGRGIIVRPKTSKYGGFDLRAKRLAVVQILEVFSRSAVLQFPMAGMETWQDVAAAVEGEGPQSLVVVGRECVRTVAYLEIRQMRDSLTYREESRNDRSLFAVTGPGFPGSVDYVPSGHKETENEALFFSLDRPSADELGDEDRLPGWNQRVILDAWHAMDRLLSTIPSSHGWAADFSRGLRDALFVWHKADWLAVERVWAKKGCSVEKLMRTLEEFAGVQGVRRVEPGSQRRTSGPAN